MVATVSIMINMTTTTAITAITMETNLHNHNIKIYGCDCTSYVRSFLRTFELSQYEHYNPNYQHYYGCHHNDGYCYYRRGACSHYSYWYDSSYSTSKLPTRRRRERRLFRLRRHNETIHTIISITSAAITTAAISHMATGYICRLPSSPPSKILLLFHSLS